MAFTRFSIRLICMSGIKVESVKTYGTVQTPIKQFYRLIFLTLSNTNCDLNTLLSSDKDAGY